MGMYTCLKFIGTVKDEYKQLILGLCENRGWDENIEYDFLKKYLKLHRRDFIPFGVMSAYNESKFGISYCNFNSFTNEWNFLCDLKNYESEIEIFIEDVVPNICDYVKLCLVWYEEQESPDIYIWDKNKMCLNLLYKGDFYDR